MLMHMMPWGERIEQAKEIGSFTEEDRRLSAEWSTCAVGYAKCPTSLLMLGCDFHTAIMDNDITWAIEIYQEIERSK